MRKIIIDVDLRVKPRLKTPKKGSDGDLTVQSDLPATDINNILSRFAGNLAELKAWQNKQQYGDATLLGKDLLELHTEYTKRLEEANVKFAENDALKAKFATFADYYNAVKNGYNGEDIVYKPVDKPVDKSVDKLVDKPVDKPVEKSVEKE